MGRVGEPASGSARSKATRPKRRHHRSHVKLRPNCKIVGFTIATSSIPEHWAIHEQCLYAHPTVAQIAFFFVVFQELPLEFRRFNISPSSCDNAKSEIHVEILSFFGRSLRSEADAVRRTNTPMGRHLQSWTIG